tara:strand:- start:106 stop:270 length:165 start_codon:yes stop_codon:yes gene_type:complete
MDNIVGQRTSYSVERRIKAFVKQNKVQKQAPKGTCSDHANRDIEDCCKKTVRRD